MYITTYEKAIIGASTFGISVTGVLLLYIIYRRQSRLPYIHPGWILGLATLFYGIFVPLLLVVDGVAAESMISPVVRHYSFDVFLLIQMIYIVTLLGFLLGELWLCITPRMRPVLGRSGIRPSAIQIGRARGRVSHPVLGFVTTVGLLIGAYLIQQNYARYGGLLGYLTINRRDAAAVGAEMGGFFFTRFQMIFHSLWAMFLSVYVTGTPTRRKLGFYAFALAYLGYMGLIFVLGTRLEILVLALGALFIVGTRQRHVLARCKKPLIMGALVIGVVFSWYAHFRGELREALVEKRAPSIVFRLEDLFPSESATGYIPGLIMIGADYKPFHQPHWMKPIPSQIARLVGLQKEVSLSQAISDYLHYPGRPAVYTVTFPTDAYLGTGSMAGVLLASFLTYVFICVLISRLYRRGTIGMGAAAIVFMNLWYVIRVELGNWFPRMWQDLVIYMIFACVCLFLGNLFDYNSKPLRD